MVILNNKKFREFDQYLKSTMNRLEVLQSKYEEMVEPERHEYGRECFVKSAEDLIQEADAAIQRTDSNLSFIKKLLGKN